ncbi:MAG TPA: single-stranded-DNA-specific exonuclease RecJ [Clostridia bacterium]|nr:single-stranded-DNA-specific exonuclease RecJ [Clostridia bacterium]
MAIYEQLKPPLDARDIDIDNFRDALGITEIASRILINRGVHDIERARSFLNPSMDNLFDPFKLEDMDKAANRVKEAISLKEHITIYGDYDVDGMTSCALLYEFLKDMGCRVDSYIPHRIDEGYGINPNAIQIIHDRGTQLLISVDCGITSIQEVDLANELGIDVIITDHHQCDDSLPKAVAVINPARDKELLDLHPLAGVGVAGKLVQAIMGASYLERYLDLIALGTVADVVPLIGDNRILVAKGLEKLNEKPCIGIEALIEVSGAKGKDINAGRIAFGLAPRLNAAGRLGDPMKGFELLTSKELATALPIAQLLEEKNRRRQSIEAEIIEEAEEMIEHHVDLRSHRIIVLAKEAWNPGIIGIAASKITEKYLRPCILIGIKNGKGVGSARSIKGFNIYNALCSSSYLMDKFGGHEQAAGLSLAKDHIDILRKELLSYCQDYIADTMLVPRYTYDVDLKPRDITYELAGELEALEPFGIGNPSPYFLLPEGRLEGNRAVGSNGKHLKMCIGLGQRQWDGIAFGMGERIDFLEVAKKVAIITALEKNQWRGICKLQFNVKHMDTIIESHDDWDEFLKVFHLKFFDVFFSNFMYNEHYKKDLWSPISKKVSDIHIEEVITNFKSTGLGNLILVNSLYNIRNIIKKMHNEDLKDKVFFSYGQPDSWSGFGTNACVLVPDYKKISYANYRNIYIFEDELPFCDIVKENKFEDTRWSIIAQKADKARKLYLYNELLVERLDFASIYKWVRAIPIGRSIWKGWLDLIRDYENFVSRPVNGFRVRLMLKVFEELNFINVEFKNRYVKIKCCQNPTHRDLDESLFFRYYNNWYNDLTISFY